MTEDVQCGYFTFSGNISNYFLFQFISTNTVEQDKRKKTFNTYFHVPDIKIWRKTMCVVILGVDMLIFIAPMPWLYDVRIYISKYSTIRLIVLRRFFGNLMFVQGVKFSD